MREFKFRVWDKELKQFNSPNVHHLEKNNGILSIVLNSDVKKIAGEDRFVIQQYTGIDDFWGKEIYEGDIIKLKGSPYLYSIEWQDYQWCINDHYVLGYDDCYQPLNECVYDRAQIIGNIFENPELLEKQ